MQNPRRKPARGDVTIGRMTFQSSPFPWTQCSRFGCDQMMACQFPFEAAKAEPHKPPINAWLELEGRPNHQVSRFQRMAPSSAQMMTSEVIATSLESIRPEEMVLATAVPQSAPSKFVAAARITAWRGVRTFVETTVAIELAVSWN